MKKKVTKALLAGVLSASMVMPVMAAPDSYEHGGGSFPVAEGTDVFAGVYVDDTDAQSRIHVEVPTLFGFVVNGTIKANDGRVVSQTTLTDENDPASTEVATIMLPNMMVTVLEGSNDYDVDNPGSGGVKYMVGGNQSGNMNFKNYSTKGTMDAAAGDYKWEGLPIELMGYVDEGIMTAEERNHWTHVQDAASAEGVSGGFKQYTVYLDGKAFSTRNESGWYGLSAQDSITLQAPDLGESFDTGTNTWSYSNLDADTKLAAAPYSTTLDFNVRVGGRRDQYKQIEESAKIGTIVWTASVLIEEDDENIYSTDGKTNNNGYLDGKYEYETNGAGEAIHNNDADGMRQDSNNSNAIDPGTTDDPIGNEYVTP